jgi:hypothetical protein
LFSPAFLLFPFFDTNGGYRKEIIIFLSFAIISFYYAKKDINGYSLLVSFVFFLLAVFSHEMSAMALPFYLYVIFKSTKLKFLQKRTGIAWAVLFTLTAAFAVILAVKLPGNKDITYGICKSLMLRGFTNDICNGAIKWLSFDVTYGFSSVKNNINAYIFVYPFLLFMAMIPVFLTNWLSIERLSIFILGFFAFLPLYFVALDWGRWIHIFVFFIYLIILSESVIFTVEIRPISIWIISLYLTTWSIPHCCADRFLLGWIEWAGVTQVLAQFGYQGTLYQSLGELFR